MEQEKITYKEITHIAWSSLSKRLRGSLERIFLAQDFYLSKVEDMENGLVKAHFKTLGSTTECAFPCWFQIQEELNRDGNIDIGITLYQYDERL